jgi:hypothetical protein
MTQNTTQKPAAYVADLTHLPKALQPLTSQTRWVLWRWELRTTKGGQAKWTKPPYRAAYPKSPAKSNDATTWGSYQDAIAAVGADLADGIGVMLKNAEVAAVDLDHVRNAETGELLDWAQRLCLEADRLGLYREITVSGNGLRFIGLSQGGCGELHRKLTFDRNSGAGIELYRNTARFITISGLQEGDCESMGSIDAYLDDLLARFGAPPPDVLDFNTAGPQHANDYYEDLIANGAAEGARSEKFQEVVWHLASKGLSIEEIVDELARHPNGIGLKYANRLLTEVARSFGKWQSRRQAAATGSSAISNTTPWPVIKVVSNELPRVVNEAEEALIQLDRDLYQHGGRLVHLVPAMSLEVMKEIPGWKLETIPHISMIEELCCAAQFTRYDARSKAWTPIRPPDDVAQALLSRRKKWKLPKLEGIVQTPFLRADGSIRSTPGYDATSKLLFKADGQVFPPIPPHPSRDDALAALGVLERLIATFPFVTKEDESVALAALLTSIDRRSMGTAPLFAFSSPVAGTGKSKLVDVCSILASGRSMAVISQGYSEVEFVKCLGASLLAGEAVISIDNCERELRSDFLCQVLTQSRMNIRVLGFSKNVETPMNAMIFATGNNLTIGGDATRRALMCNLDTGVERPELRSFAEDVAKEAQRRRGELVTAVLTMLRAWHLAKQRIALPAFGSFEEWSFRIREPLVWLGKCDPCETLAEVRANDPRRSELVAVVEQWKTHLTVNQQYTAQEVIGRALIDPDFHNALLAVAQSRSGGSVSSARLGLWLNQVKGKLVNGLKLLRDGIRHGYTLWKLTQV